jgi:hypothetical protein
MDPARIFKSRAGIEADGEDSSVAPSSSRPSSFRRTQSSQSQQHMVLGRDNCSYWSTMRRICLNGNCRDESQRFRQCAGRPREVMVLNEDGDNREERWVPAAEAGAGDDDDRDNMFADVAMVLPRSFRDLGGATDTLLAEVAPELERMQRRMRDSPWSAVGEMIDALQQQTTTPPSHSKGGGGGGGGDGGREIPIEDRNGSPTQQNKKIIVEPLSNIGRSISGWMHKITGGAAGEKDDSLQREPSDIEDED